MFNNPASNREAAVAAAKKDANNDPRGKLIARAIADGGWKAWISDKQWLDGEDGMGYVYTLALKDIDPKLENLKKLGFSLMQQFKRYGVKDKYQGWPAYLGSPEGTRGVKGQVQLDEEGTTKIGFILFARDSKEWQEKDKKEKKKPKKPKRIGKKKTGDAMLEDESEGMGGMAALGLAAVLALGLVAVVRRRRRSK